MLYVVYFARHVFWDVFCVGGCVVLKQQLKAAVHIRSADGVFRLQMYEALKPERCGMTLDYR